MTARDGNARTVSFSRRGVAAGLAASGVTGFGAVAAAQEATPSPAPVPPDFKVVLHASEPTHWTYVLSNLTNLTAQWPKAQIRVVVDGTAVYGLQGTTDVTAKLAPLAEAGVELQVCPNALHEHGIDPKTMPSYAQITLGGVVALVAAQRDGYAYIKP